MITLEKLQLAFPRGKEWILQGVVDYQESLADYGIDTDLRRQHLLAQLAHESDGFRTTTEYASGAAYEGRRDLGNVHPGDGKRYRGRGLIQLTGRANYVAYSYLFPGDDIVETPEIVAQFPYAWEVSIAYWSRKNLNKYADLDDIVTITRRINGGLNGLEDRKLRLAKIRELEL